MTQPFGSEHEVMKQPTRFDEFFAASWEPIVRSLPLPLPLPLALPLPLLAAHRKSRSAINESRGDLSTWCSS